MAKPEFKPVGWTGPFVLPDIREMVGLDSDEKVFLYDLASHNDFTESAALPRLLQRTGLGPNVFKRVRTSLEHRGLITVDRRPGKTWLYTLNLTGIRAFPKAYQNSKKKATTKSPSTQTPSGRQTPSSEQTPTGVRREKKNKADDYATRWLDARRDAARSKSHAVPDDHLSPESWYQDDEN